jgi:hypothetical protein
MLEIRPKLVKPVNDEIKPLDSEACRKLGHRSHDGLCRPPISRFVSRRETETDRQHQVLLAHCPRAGETEAFPQPQHGLEPPDRLSCRVDGLKAADPRHRPFDPKDPMGDWLATYAPGE